MHLFPQTRPGLWALLGGCSPGFHKGPTPNPQPHGGGGARGPICFPNSGCSGNEHFPFCLLGLALTWTKWEQPCYFSVHLLDLKPFLHEWVSTYNDHRCLSYNLLLVIQLSIYEKRSPSCHQRNPGRETEEYMGRQGAQRAA